MYRSKIVVRAKGLHSRWSGARFYTDPGMKRRGAAIKLAAGRTFSISWGSNYRAALSGPPGEAHWPAVIEVDSANWQRMPQAKLR
jgi:hypothetical protein